MSDFKIEITSVPDREKLVAEIWHKEILIAELNQESEKLEIEFYLKENVRYNLIDFLEILQIAKIKIVSDGK